MTPKHDFGFGDTRGIRDLFVAHAGAILNQSLIGLWKDCGYPKHEGEDRLILRLRLLIRNLTGYDYKHVLVTNGATNALNAYLYAAKNRSNDKKTHVLTNKLYFGFYPGIIENAGLIHVPTEITNTGDREIQIIDSPSNPLGVLCPLTNECGGANRVWDAAYFSPTYCGILAKNLTLKNPKIIPPHDAMAGSLNKLTGLNGLRVGWLATDDDGIYNKAYDYVTNDLCGVSMPSQMVAAKLLENIDLDPFYSLSKALLDSNRTEMQRLDKLFGGQKIPETGMFALFEVDNKILKILDKASVKVMSGKFCGDPRMSARINMANSNQATKLMISDILKADG